MTTQNSTSRIHRIIDRLVRASHNAAAVQSNDPAPIDAMSVNTRTFASRTSAPFLR